MIGFASFSALGGIASLQRIPGPVTNERTMNWPFWLLQRDDMMVADLTRGLVEASFGDRARMDGVRPCRCELRAGPSFLKVPILAGIRPLGPRSFPGPTPSAGRSVCGKRDAQKHSLHCEKLRVDVARTFLERPSAMCT